MFKNTVSYSNWFLTPYFFNFIISTLILRKDWYLSKAKIKSLSRKGEVYQGFWDKQLHSLYLCMDYHMSRFHSVSFVTASLDSTLPNVKWKRQSMKDHTIFMAVVVIQTCVTSTTPLTWAPLLIPPVDHPSQQVSTP